jgi:hypothetical protein
LSVYENKSACRCFSKGTTMENFLPLFLFRFQFKNH